MSPPYRYIKVNNYHICLQQGLAVLAWILYTKRDDLRTIYTPWIEKKVYRGKIVFLRHCYDFILGNIKILLIFLLYRFKLRNTELPIELPVFGQVCKHVHRGYKVFDFRRRVVTKLFDSGVSRTSIMQETERLKTVSSIDAAPALGKWNIDEGWYEEEYVRGEPVSKLKSIDSGELLQSFDLQIIPLLNTLLIFKEPRLSNPLQYVREVFGELNPETRDVGNRAISSVADYINAVMRRLELNPSSDIYLVFSHGDFCPANMLRTSDGMRIVDWETASYRSALFDFYSYYFYRPVCARIPLSNMMQELDQALPLYISRIPSKGSAIAEHISSGSSVYRWIFYVEYLCKLVERTQTDNNLDIEGFIERYMDAFERYETLLADGGGMRSDFQATHPENYTQRYK